jgi:hypothetical protein
MSNLYRLVGDVAANNFTLRFLKDRSPSLQSMQEPGTASMLLSFANLWLQQELSDATLVLQALPNPRSSSDACNSLPMKPSVLRTLPAHKVLLSASDYFKAQVRHAAPKTVTLWTWWQRDSFCEEKFTVQGGGGAIELCGW